MRPRALVLALCLVAACSDSLGPVPPGTFGLVSGGFEHTCGLLGNGVAYCWGYNGSFQLGSGAVNNRDTLPRAVSGGLTFTWIDGGEGHTCAITTTGDAYCWGASNDGALGNSTVPTTPDPVLVEGGLKFRAITLGRTHTCGLSTSGAAYCWGNNDFGKLGRDTAVIDVSTPIAVAGGHTFTAIAAGDYHTCAIAVGGASYCWGDNFFGALGTGDTALRSAHPNPEAVAGGLAFKAIDGGNVHTCGVTTGGDAYCWGAGQFGQLGNGSRTTQRTPVRVTGGHTYTAVSIGTNHSCALAVGGQLWCWGNNGLSQLAGAPTETCPLPPPSIGGVPCTSTPIPAASGLEFRALGTGGYHTCVIGTGGGAYCWGANNEGQVGIGAAGTIVTAAARVTDP